MKFTNIEGVQAQETVSKTNDAQLCEISESQLAYVGGGMADTIGH